MNETKVQTTLCTLFDADDDDGNDDDDDGRHRNGEYLIET